VGVSVPKPLRVYSVNAIRSIPPKPPGNLVDVVGSYCSMYTNRSISAVPLKQRSHANHPSSKANSRSETVHRKDPLYISRPTFQSCTCHVTSVGSIRYASCPSAVAFTLSIQPEIHQGSGAAYFCRDAGNNISTDTNALLAGLRCARSAARPDSPDAVLFTNVIRGQYRTILHRR
jgi:hypothetical protein